MLYVISFCSILGKPGGSSKMRVVQQTQSVEVKDGEECELLFLTKYIRGENSWWSFLVVLLPCASKLAMNKFSLSFHGGC